MVINGRLRAFIAVPLSDEALEGLKSVQDLIMKTGIFAGFPRISSVHITLKFLGEIGQDQLPIIKSKLKEKISDFESFTLKIKGLGAFPSLSRPRVAWAGIEASGRLFRLQGDIEDAMREIGFEPEKRSFNPHITLARIKSPRNTDVLEGMLREMENFNIGISPVEAVRIYQSILKPDGAVYKVLEEIHSGGRK